MIFNKTEKQIEKKKIITFFIDDKRYEKKVWLILQKNPASSFKTPEHCG